MLKQFAARICTVIESYCSDFGVNFRRAVKIIVRGRRSVEAPVICGLGSSNYFSGRSARFLLAGAVVSSIFLLLARRLVQLLN